MASTNTNRQRMPTLAQRVHDLPRELFDVIFELTFTLDKKEVRINRRYKPPVQLQINQALRQSFADEFYSTTHFVFPTRELIGKWAMSLPKEHHALAKTFKRLVDDRYLEFDDDRLDYAFDDICNMAGELQKCRCPECANDFFLNMLREKSDGSLKMVWVGFEGSYCEKGPDGYLLDVDLLPWN